jgi:hypothetical protein
MVFKMVEQKIHAVHDRDLEKLLKSLNLLEDLLAGKIECYLCKCKITMNNLGFIFPEKGEIRICCDKPDCFFERIHKSEGLQEKSERSEQ